MSSSFPQQNVLLDFQQLLHDHMKNLLHPVTVFLLSGLRSIESRVVHLWNVVNLHFGIAVENIWTRQVVSVDVFTNIPRRYQHPRKQPHNFGVAQLMSWDHHVRVTFFRIDFCERVVAEGKQESAFATFFETRRNTWYCMMLKPVMKHNTSYVLVTPKCVSNYGWYFPIFMEKMIRIWICGSVQLFVWNGLHVQCSLWLWKQSCYKTKS